MLDRFVFENHLGQRFVGLENGVYLNYSDLRDYAWSFDTINNRISRFYRQITPRKLPLTVICESEDEATAVKNRLFDLAESDIEAMIPGKIFVGDYYTKGFITASTKSEYLISKRYCKIVLTFTSNDPSWYREMQRSFIPGASGIASGSGTDYPYDFPFDYAVSRTGQTIFCDSTRSNAFRLRIYGPATNPTVTIGGHAYSINGTIGKGETLLIDSTTKTIVLTKSDGSKVNWFDNRSRKSYIFQEIPTGQHTVVWDESFGFDLTIIEKRSEPKWT